MRFTQIAAAAHGDAHVLYALNKDGVLYKYTPRRIGTTGRTYPEYWEPVETPKEPENFFPTQAAGR